MLKVTRSAAISCLIVFLLSSISCQNLQTRSQVAAGKTPETAQPSKAPTSPSGTAPVVVPPPSVVTPAPPPPQESVRIGVILGPGAMKTYAQIGVLKEMERARIPIHAMVGLEWGAVMAGLYSSQGKANDLEWRAFRIKDEEIYKSSFLGSRPQPQLASSASGYLNTVFGSETIDRHRIEFACPVYNFKQERFQWMNRGRSAEGIGRCLLYPPLTMDNGGTLAAPFSIEQAVSYLQSRGANFLILVNVLAQGEMVRESEMREDFATHVLWSEIKRQMARPVGIQMVISVNTSGHPLNHVGGRRALVDVGVRAAAEPVSKLVSQFGF